MLELSSLISSYLPGKYPKPSVFANDTRIPFLGNLLAFTSLVDNTSVTPGASLPVNLTEVIPGDGELRKL